MSAEVIAGMLRIASQDLEGARLLIDVAMAAVVTAFGVDLSRPDVPAAKPDPIR